MDKSPFLISPPALINFSGGRTSGYMLHEMLQANGGRLPDGSVVSFQNTGKERLETLDFVHAVETRWDIPVVWLEYDTPDFDPSHVVGGRTRKEIAQNQFKVVTYETANRTGEPFRKLINYLAMFRMICKDAPPVLPNPVQRICTSYLKIKAAKRYMRSLGYTHWDNYLGIRYDEPDRYAKMRSDTNYECFMPLYEEGIVKADVNAFWANNDFDLGIPSEEGNCDLCFLKSIDKLVTIMIRTEEYDSFWIEMEALTGQTFKRGRPAYQQIRDMIRTNDPYIQKLLASKEKVVDCFCGE